MLALRVELIGAGGSEGMTKRSSVWGLVAGVGASAIALGAFTSLSSCTNSSSASDSDDAGDAGICEVPFGDATVNICFDAAFDGFTPGTSGGPPAEIAFIRIVELNGSCKGTASKDNDCTLSPSDYTATVALIEPPTAGPPSGSIQYSNAAVMAGPYSGTVAAFVHKTQPAANGTKTCNMVESACNEFKGTEKDDPFLLQARRVGGTGELSTMEFSVATLHEPTSCSGKVFEPVDEDARVVFSPTPTISALKNGPITLTGQAKFTLGPLAQGLVGDVDCTYTLKVRPTDATGK